jgi:hypothetical protein
MRAAMPAASIALAERGQGLGAVPQALVLDRRVVGGAGPGEGLLDLGQAVEIMEAIWVAAEMRAGGAFAHSTVALHGLLPFFAVGRHYGHTAVTGLTFAAIALPSVIRPPFGALTGPHGRPAVQFRPHL